MQPNDTIFKILRYALIGGIFLIPLVIPFIVTKSMFFPFITGKNFTFRIIVELLLGGWLVLAWNDPAYRLRFSWILGAVTVFLGVVTLADVFGQDPLRSFWSNYERMDGLITLIHLFAFFVVAGSILRDSSLLWKRFLQTSLGASIVISIYCIFQLLGFAVINQGGVRIDATFGNATYLATYLLVHIFLAAFLFAGEKKSLFLRAIYGSVVLVQVIILFNTATRGAFVALLGGAVFSALLVLILEFKDSSLKKPAFGFFIGLLVIFGGLFGLKHVGFIHSDSLFGRLTNISITEGQSRFLIWNMAIQATKEHPLLGWGQDNFMLAFSKYYDPQMYGQEPWFDRAHDIVFDWLVAGGVLGLLAYLSLFCALIYALWVYPKRKILPLSLGGREGLSIIQKSIMTGLLLTYFIQNLFVFDNVMSYILFFSVLAYFHGRSHEKAPFALPASLANFFYDNDFVSRLIAPVIIVVTLFSIYSLNMREISANRALLRGIDIRAIQSATTSDAQRVAIQERLNNFKTALGSSLGRTEAREQLVQASLEFAGAPIPEDLRQEFFSLAESEMRAQINEVPGNVRYHLFLASLLTAYRMPEETITYLKKALTVSPKKQNIHYLLANAYLNQGKTEEAVDILRQAFELEKKNDQARNLYVAILVRAGQAEKAEALLTEGFGTSDVTNMDVANAYLAVGRFDKVISFWKRKVEQNPADLQGHLSLSAAYLAAGSRDKAILELEATIEHFPDFKKQGEYFIKEIKAGRNP